MSGYRQQQYAVSYRIFFMSIGPLKYQFFRHTQILVLYTGYLHYNHRSICCIWVATRHCTEAPPLLTCESHCLHGTSPHQSWVLQTIYTHVHIKWITAHNKVILTVKLISFPKSHIINLLEIMSNIYIKKKNQNYSSLEIKYIQIKFYV